MKRYWILTLIGLVLCLGVAWAMKSMPRLLSDEECSLIYQRYADDPGIEASFVKGFRVNDTLAIDATLLHATDSAGWQRLVDDFHLSKAIDPSTYNIPKSVTLGRVSRKDPTKKVSTPDEPFSIRVVFPHEKEIHVYDTENQKQSRALHRHLMMNMNNPNT